MTYNVNERVVSAKGARRFSVLQSTEDNHRSNEMKFYGPFAHIRSQLDYNYHSNYTIDRQRLQNSIIEGMLDDVIITDVNGDICTTPTDPWIVFTAGAMGAGKGHTINWLVENELFPLQGFVSIDPDEIRRRLPEYPLYVEMCPLMAGELTRKEAGFMAEILTLAAIQAGKNALVDGSLRDWQWYTYYFQMLKEKYQGLRIGILHVIAPKEVIFERARIRGIRTGRVIPKELLEMAYEQVPNSVEKLAPLADYFCALNNEPSKDVEIVTEGITWESFKENWYQTCAWSPRDKLNVSVRQSIVVRLPSSRFLFSKDNSTHDNYKSSEDKYYGKFAHIRTKIHDEFYGNYIKERQFLQDSIVEDSLKRPVLAKTNSTESIDEDKTPWIIFLSGATSVGKSHCIRELVKKDRLPLSSFIYVNANLIKLKLPEVHVYAHEKGEKKVNELTYRESLYIRDILIYAALEKEHNIIANITPLCPKDLSHRLEKLSAAYPLYRIALIHVSAPPEYALQSAEEKAKESNSSFCKKTTELEMVKVRVAAEGAAHVSDFYCEISNIPGLDLEIVSPDGFCWNQFEQTFNENL